MRQAFLRCEFNIEKGLPDRLHGPCDDSISISSFSTFVRKKSFSLEDFPMKVSVCLLPVIVMYGVVPKRLAIRRRGMEPASRPPPPAASSSSAVTPPRL